MWIKTCESAKRIVEVEDFKLCYNVFFKEKADLSQPVALPPQVLQPDAAFPFLESVGQLGWTRKVCATQPSTVISRQPMDCTLLCFVHPIHEFLQALGKPMPENPDDQSEHLSTLGKQYEGISKAVDAITSCFEEPMLPQPLKRLAEVKTQLEGALTSCRAQLATARNDKLKKVIAAAAGFNADVELVRFVESVSASTFDMDEIRNVAASIFVEGGAAESVCVGYFEAVDAWEAYHGLVKDAEQPTDMKQIEKTFVILSSVQTLTRPEQGLTRRQLVQKLVEDALSPQQLETVPDAVYALLAKEWRGLPPRKSACV